MKWNDLSLDIHRQEDQVQRIDSSFEVVFSSIDNNIAITDHGYTVTLDHCTCPDFIHRKLPCKHIYALAKVLNRFVAPQKIERTKNLIVELDDNGFSKNWMFVVRPVNFLSLDIRWNSVNQNYTQGEDYRFITGATYYDTPSAYDNKKWGDVINEIEFSLQVISSTSNYRHYDFEKKDDVLIAKPIIEHGVTSFNAYRVNHNLHREVFYKKFSCNNKEFVKLLKYGTCNSISGTVIDIQDWYD